VEVSYGGWRGTERGEGGGVECFDVSDNRLGSVGAIRVRVGGGGEQLTLVLEPFVPHSRKEFLEFVTI
jgi:hypothetical protein